MTLCNFSDPLAAALLDRIEALAGRQVERVTEARAHFDHEQAFVPQTRALAALPATVATSLASHGEQGVTMGGQAAGR